MTFGPKDGDDKPESHRAIEENLRKIYEEDMSEAMPDRFARLIENLRNSEVQSSSNALCSDEEEGKNVQS